MKRKKGGQGGGRNSAKSTGTLATHLSNQSELKMTALIVSHSLRLFILPQPFHIQKDKQQ